MDVEREMVEIKGVMVKYCGIIRNGRDIARGMEAVSALLNRLEAAALPSIRAMELYNMATVAMEFLTARTKEESVGAHFRIDEGGTRDV